MDAREEKECRFCLQREDGREDARYTKPDKHAHNRKKMKSRSPRNAFLSPCQCKGTASYVHRKCLAKWMVRDRSQQDTSICAVCKSPFVTDIELEKAIQFEKAKQARNPKHTDKILRRRRRQMQRFNLSVLTAIGFVLPWVGATIFFMTGGQGSFSLSWGDLSGGIVPPFSLQQDEANEEGLEYPPLWKDNCIGVSAAPSVLCRKSNGRHRKEGNPHTTFANLMCYVLPLPECAMGNLPPKML